MKVTGEVYAYIWKGVFDNNCNSFYFGEPLNILFDQSKYKNQNTFNYNDEEYTEDFSTLIGLDLGYVGRGWGIFSYNLEFGWYDIFIYNFSAGAGLRLGNFYIAANLNYGFDLIQMYDSDYFGYGAKLMYRYNKDSFIGFDWKRVEYVDDTDSGNSFKRTSISLSWGGCF